MVCGPSVIVESVGILKMRETAGIAVRPDRSASRLLAASQISSFSLSEDNQPRGLMMMRVKYAGMPSSSIPFALLVQSLGESHDEGFRASLDSVVRNNDTEGFWCNCGRSRTGEKCLVQCQPSGLGLDDSDRLPCNGPVSSGLEANRWRVAGV